MSFVHFYIDIVLFLFVIDMGSKYYYKYCLFLICITSIFHFYLCFFFLVQMYHFLMVKIMCFFNVESLENT